MTDRPNRAMRGAGRAATLYRPSRRKDGDVARDEDDNVLGGRFWLKIFGLLIVGVIALIIVFAFLGWALITWGLLGFFIFISLVLIGYGWFYDRRQKRRVA